MVMTGRRSFVTVTDAKGGRSSFRSRYASDVRIACSCKFPRLRKSDWALTTISDKTDFLR
jgi:hypothetical protein